MAFGFGGTEQGLSFGVNSALNSISNYVILHYDVTQTYDSDAGTVLLKPQSANGKNKRVRLQTPTFTRTVEFLIVTMGAEPRTIPSPFSSDAKETLLYRKVVTPTPMFGQDATPTFIVAGIYIYEREEPYPLQQPLLYRYSPAGPTTQDYRLVEENFSTF